VEWTRATAVGDLVPREEERVALLAEDLKIQLLDDGVHYDVVARYTLRNDGPPVTVHYGVPLFWYAAETGETDVTPDRMQRAATAAERAYVAAMRITLGERTFPCALQAVSRTEPPQEPASLRAWCVADLEIPSGKSLALTLSYTGSYRFVDFQYEGSVFAEHGMRVLDYDLVPAGYWKGPAQALSIEIDTGRWSDFFLTSHPQGWQADGTRRLWRATNADLKYLGRVTGTLVAGPVLASEERMAYRPGIKLDAAASSELPRDGAVDYRASNVLDGRGSTAWCASRMDEPSWIELRFRNAPASTCTVYGFVLVPGYAKSQGSWIGNERLRRFTLAPCDQTADINSQRVEPSTRADSSAIVVPAPSGTEKVRPGQCVRLTLWTVDDGPSGDRCISEFKPIVNCP
jgi:hypothetical protein